MRISILLLIILAGMGCREKAKPSGKFPDDSSGVIVDTWQSQGGTSTYGNVQPQCTDDDGKTWWRARSYGKGGFACYESDRDESLEDFKNEVAFIYGFAQVMCERDHGCELQQHLDRHLPHFTERWRKP